MWVAAPTKSDTQNTGGMVSAPTPLVFVIRRGGSRIKEIDVGRGTFISAKGVWPLQIDWRNWFEQGLSYDEFINTYANDTERSRWQSAYERIRLTPEQEELLKGFVREMNVLVLAATWCGDCVNQGPIYRRFEEANDRIKVRLLERDQVPELRDALKINGGARIPVVVFLSEDFLECARYGERTLAMYRQLAYSQLEAGRPTNIASSGDELLAQATAEWLNEFERIHWMLRLSPRLRKLHGD